MAIKDYSTDPDLNTQISGINIAEGCAPSGINNAIRQLMADVKEAGEAQAAKDAEQDAAINSKVATVNGLTPDANGNVDVGGMPLGTVFPYTGKDVPAGTLRADGSTYSNMRASFPEFYEWVVASGLTVSLGEYALVEGSCGFYGLDISTGTVRMPTLAAGVFGTTAAGQYGQAVQAGLPNITAYSPHSTSAYGSLYPSGAFGISDASGLNLNGGQSATFNSLTFDASRSSAIYGRSDTVTPSHVKYPWVIVVYNAAVPPSVAQAGEFVELLDGKVDKVNPKDSEGNDILTSAGGSLSGKLTFSVEQAVAKNNDASILRIIGATSYANGGNLVLYGKDHNNKGAAELQARDGSKTGVFRVFANGTASLNGSNLLTSSGGNLLNGSNVAVGNVEGNTFTLPAGGTWAYTYHRSTYNDNAGGSGTAAGGTTITAREGPTSYFAIRIA